MNETIHYLASDLLTRVAVVTICLYSGYLILNSLSRKKAMNFPAFLGKLFSGIALILKGLGFVFKKLADNLKPKKVR